MADDLTFNFSSEPAAAPARRNNNKGGRWTDRAKERKQTKIEQRKAGRPAGAGGSSSNSGGGGGGGGGAKRPREDGGEGGDRQQRKKPAGAPGGKGRLEREAGPGGKKQFISSLFTAEGLPEASKKADAAPILPGKASNAPLVSAPAATEEGDEDEEGEKGEQDEGPDPAPALSELGLMPPVVQALAGKLGITGPTACQAGAIPRLVPVASSAAKKGKGKAKKASTAEDFAHDAILRAQTGSGKTLTFLLPMLQDLLTLDPSLLASPAPAGPSSSSGDASKSSHPGRDIGTLSLILAPTRELASQIHTVLSSLLSSLPSSPHFTISPRALTAGLLVGGANRTHEKRRLRKGCPIVVATPGRLLDHLKTTEAFRLAGEPVRAPGQSGKPGGGAGRGANTAPLGQRGGMSGAAPGAAASKLGLRWLIVDECDRLMDLGFEEQMRGILEELEKRKGAGASSSPTSPTRRRTILCSATASEGVDRLAALSGSPSAPEGAETPSWPVVGARQDAQVREPVRKDLTAPAAAKRGRDEDGEGGEDGAAEGEDGGAKQEANALALPSGFTPPSQLLHNYVVVPPKLRFVTLLALLRKLLRGAQDKNMKVLVFMSCTDAVEFWWKALGGMSMSGRDGAGSGGGRGAPSAAMEEDLEKADEKEGKGKEKEKLVSLHPLLPATPVYRLHGNLPLQTRLTSLAGFSGKYEIEEGKRKGEKTDAAVMLCTSVAARGLDVKGVGCVVQVDAPTEGGVTEYVHRVGRTARAGAQGSAYSFLLPTETEYTTLLEDGINAATPKGEKRVRLREMGVEEVLRQGYGGEGREYETRATDVQMGFERWVNDDEDTAALARRAFQAHVRAYATHPSAEKYIFNTKALHLGHLAKSFGMREAPGHAQQSGGGKGGAKGAKRARTSVGGAGEKAREQDAGFEVGRKKRQLTSEERMKQLMRGSKANGAAEFQIAGVDEIKSAVRR
ncbi:hypothetical protein JCM10213_005763 [Rhodosporidiobolus nylandii]